MTSSSIKMLSRNVEIFAGNTNTLFSFLMSNKDDLTSLQMLIAQEIKDKTVLFVKDLEEHYKAMWEGGGRQKRRKTDPGDYIMTLVKGNNGRFTKNVRSAVTRMVIFFTVDIPWAVSVGYPMDMFGEFVGALCARSDAALITHGDMVGIVAAQSCSERFTQTTLNSFHVAGMKKSAVVGIKRIEDILDGRKTLMYPTLGPIVVSNDDDPSVLVERTLNDYCTASGVRYQPEKVGDDRSGFVGFFFGIDQVTWERVLKPNLPTGVSQDMFHDVDTLYVTFPRDKDSRFIELACRALACRPVTGIPNAIEYDEEDGLLLFRPKTAMVRQRLVDKSMHSIIDNAMLLDMCPSIDLTKMGSNDIYYIQTTFGIAAAEIFIFEELKRTLGSEGININDRHIRLIASNMTASGGIMPNTFSGVDIDNSIILKATFQESTKTFAAAAAMGIVDELTDVSAQILMGAPARIGTTTAKPVYREVGPVVERGGAPPMSPGYVDGTPEYAELPDGYTSDGDLYVPSSPVYQPASPHNDDDYLREPDIHI